MRIFKGANSGRLLSSQPRNKRQRNESGRKGIKHHHLQLLPKLLPALGIFVHENAHAALPTNKLAKPVLPDLNLPVTPAEHVRPLLTSMHLANMHPLGTRAGIGQDDGAPEAAVPGAVAHEAQARRVVEVVGLLAVGVELAGEGELGEGAAARGREGLLLALGVDAVQVAVPDAGVARVAEEDERVGEGLEPVCDGGLEGLVGLGVVVHHEGLCRVSVWSVCAGVPGVVEMKGD